MTEAVMKVDPCFARASAEWRSVRVRFHWRTDKSWVRAALSRIAEQYGLPRKRTAVRAQTSVTAGVYGYIRVYRGEGSTEERKVFQKVLRAAGQLKPPDPKPLPPFTERELRWWQP